MTLLEKLKKFWPIPLLLLAFTVAALSGYFHSQKPDLEPPRAVSAQSDRTEHDREREQACATRPVSDWQWQNCLALFKKSGRFKETPLRPADARGFSYTETFNDGTKPVLWDIEVTELKCGAKSILGGRQNPAWDGLSTTNQTIPAVAPAGYEFCVLHATFTNTGKTPSDGPFGFGQLETRRGFYSQSVEDEAVTDELNRGTFAKNPVVRANPGESTPYTQVWTVSQRIGEITAVLFPRPTVNGGSTRRIAIRGSSR